MTKDVDFKLLVGQLGAPPQVLWVRSGNASTRALLDLFEQRFGDILTLFQSGEPLVEITL